MHPRANLQLNASDRVSGTHKIVFSHFSGDKPLPHWYMINPDGTKLRSLPWFYGAGDPLDWVQPR